MQHTHIIVHHTGAEEKETAQVKRYHLSLGWRDIGYNYVIERSGEVVKGRSIDIPGAHCRAGGMNHCSIGVAVIGNLENHPMLPQQHQALVKLLQMLARKHGIQTKNLLGHREVPEAATACPGRFTDMQSLRNIAGDIPRRGVSPFLNQPSPEDTLWRVQVGAFSTRKKAENYANQLKKQGIDAFVVSPNA